MTVIAGPPDPYGLIGMIQTVYCCYFTAHSDTWPLATERYPFAAVTWASVPLALRFVTENGHTKDLRLTVVRRRLPHGPLARRPLARPSTQTSPAAKSYTATGAIPAHARTGQWRGLCHRLQRRVAPGSAISPSPH